MNDAFEALKLSNEEIEKEKSIYHPPSKRPKVIVALIGVLLLLTCHYYIRPGIVLKAALIAANNNDYNGVLKYMARPESKYVTEFANSITEDRPIQEFT